MHRAGFGTSHSLIVHVTAGTEAAHDVVLTLARNGPGPKNGPAAESEILAAGMGTGAFIPQPDTAPDPAAVEHEADHDHSEFAWRLRHLPRSVLQESIERVVVEPDDATDAEGTFFGRAMTAPGRAAAALFADLPFTGQVNLMTSSSFEKTGQLLSDASVPRGVAYVSIGAAAGQRGNWSVQGAMTQGDVSSWLFAGSFLARSKAVHRYEAGMAYSAQHYTGANPASLAAVAEGTRTAGAVFAFDTWTLSRRATLVYGGRVARYGYIENALFSPRARLDDRGHRYTCALLAAAAERAEAPWRRGVRPVERRTKPGCRPSARSLRSWARGSAPSARDTYEFSVAQDLGTEAVLGVRTFYQRTDDQVVTLFGLGLASAAGELDHYSVCVRR